MKAIVLNPEKEFDAIDFEKYLLKICNQHKKEGRALAFAFIVYDFENYTIKEIIENNNYWVALDIISGKKLTIFYVDSQDSYFKRRQKEIHQDEIRRQSQNSEIKSLGFVHTFVLKSTPLDETIAVLKEKFGVDDYVNHPFVLFFQTDGENVIDYFVVTLKQDEIEKAFLELKRHIDNAVKSVSKVKPKYSNNHQEIFNLIKNGVKSGNVIHLIKTKVIGKFGIGTIISLFKTIAGYG